MKILWFLPGLLCSLAMAAVTGNAAPVHSDMQQQIEMTLQQYAEVKTDAQRAAIVEYLQKLKRPDVIAAVLTHIEQARNGHDATLYNGLIEGLRPEACAEVIRQLGLVEGVEQKAKLVVALRHCEGEAAQRALGSALSDKRVVHFEAHGKFPRRVCDLAYDELFLKLRQDPKYGLDPSPKMHGVIRESTPTRDRDVLIEKLSSRLVAAEPSPAAPKSPPSPPAAIPSSKPSLTPPVSSPRPSPPPKPLASALA